MVFEFKRSTLGEVCHLITDGKHGDCENQDSSGYYFLSAKNIQDGKLDYTGARQITKEDFLQTHRRTQLEPLDILIVSTGATIGRMTLTPYSDRTSRTTFQKSVAILKPNKNIVSAHWLYYMIRSNLQGLVNYAGGSAQPNLLLRDLRAFEISLPPLKTQRRIAEILSAYDDLIENNSQRVKALEQAAQDLYQEWFVHFRFPNHENVQIVESELGLIPQEWEVAQFQALATQLNEGLEPFKYPDEEFLHYSIPAFDERRIPKIELGDTIRSRKFLITENCVLISKINPRIPRVWMIEVNPSVRSVTSTEFLAYSPLKNVSISFLYALCTSSDFLDRLRMLAGGTSTSHQRVRITDLQQLPVVMPPLYLMQGFEDIVSSTQKLVNQLRTRNQLLREARDLLLPRLVSGELDVSEVEFMYGEV